MQQLNPSEISDIIRQRIEGLDVRAEAQNEGTIVGVSDGIVRIHGLADAQYGEMIEFDGGLYGMALNLDMDLEPFARINPCGYENLEVIDLRTLGIELSMDELRTRYQSALLGQLGFDSEDVVSRD